MALDWIKRLVSKSEPGGGWDWLAAWSRGHEGGLGSGVSVEAAPDSVAWVYAAMDAIGTNASMPELQVTINDEEVPDTNEVRALLDRPSPDTSLEDALYITACQLSVLGKSAWIKEPAEVMASTIRLPEWVSFPDPRDLQRKPGGMGWVQTLPNGTRRSLPNEAVIFMRKPHVYKPMEALGKLGPLANTIRAQVEAERFNADFFKNGAQLSGFLKTPNTLTSKQRESIRASFEDRHQGRGKRHKVGLFEGGMEWVPNQSTHRDMSFVELDRLDRDKILAVFRVPPVEISILDTANYNNAQEQRRIFWLEVILPMLKSVIRSLNYQLCVASGRRERITLNTKGIQALQKDMGPLAETASKLFDRGVPWVTIDQLLELGMDFSEMGDLAETSFMSGGLLPAQDMLFTGFNEADDSDDSDDSDDAGSVEVSDAGKGKETADPAASLNGAQVSSLMSIIAEVLAGRLPKEAAVQIMVSAFAMTEEQARRIMASIEEGSVPPEATEERAARQWLRQAVEGGSQSQGSTNSSHDRKTLAEQAATLHASKAEMRQSPTGDHTYDTNTKVWLKNLEGSANLQRRQVPKYRRAILKMRKRMLKALVEYEKEQAKLQDSEVKKAIAAAGSAARLGLPERAPMVKSIEQGILKVIMQKYNLTEAELEAWFKETWEKGLKVGVEQVRDDAGFGSREIPDKASGILAQKEIKLSERLGAPAEEVRKQLSRSLEQLFQGEADFKQVIEAAREGIKTATNNSARRAQTIARTETGQVVQSGKQAWAEENGVTHMQWISARVDTTRDTHASEDGNIARVSDPFPVTGLMHPKDPAGPAEEVINCLCDMVPVPESVAERRR